MSIKIASLNSGSNANCYYVGNKDEAVLVDAGLSCRETEKRMKQLSLSMHNVKALFVSHEHSDHITGVPGLSKKYQLPVYITDDTFRNSFIPVETHLLRSFRSAKAITIGGLSVVPFRKSHDAADPHSFMISANGINVGVITDIGYACKRVINYFSQCHAAFLEANYCDDMLEKGSYPYHLKKRIRGDEGHLSNAQALELFQHYRSDKLQLLILSHLSNNNNKPQVVEKLFAPYAGTTKIVIASRYAASEVFEINMREVVEGKFKPKAEIRIKRTKKINEQQLTLF